MSLHRERGEGHLLVTSSPSGAEEGQLRREKSVHGASQPQKPAGPPQEAMLSKQDERIGDLALGSLVAASRGSS